MLGTIIVSILVLAAIVAVIAKLIRDKRNGKNITSCGGNCGGCPMAGSCHRKDKE